MKTIFILLQSTHSIRMYYLPYNCVLVKSDVSNRH